MKKQAETKAYPSQDTNKRRSSPKTVENSEEMVGINCKRIILNAFLKLFNRL